MITRRILVLCTAVFCLAACEKSGGPAASGGDASAPKGPVKSSGPKVTAVGTVADGAEVPGVDKVVEGMLVDFQRCLQKALDADPKAKGSVRVTVELGATGAVGSASTAASKGVDESLASCIASRVRKGPFPAPKGPRATVMVTVDMAP